MIGDCPACPSDCCERDRYQVMTDMRNSARSNVRTRDRALGKSIIVFFFFYLGCKWRMGQKSGVWSLVVGGRSHVKLRPGAPLHRPDDFSTTGSWIRIAGGFQSLRSIELIRL